MIFDIPFYTEGVRSSLSHAGEVGVKEEALVLLIPICKGELRNSAPIAASQSRPTQSSMLGGTLPPVYCYDCCGCSPCTKSSCSLLHNTPLPPAPASRNPIAGTASSAGVSREIWFLKDGHRLLREQHCRTFFIITASWCHILVTVP